MKHCTELKKVKREMTSKPTWAEKAFRDRLKMAGVNFKTQMILGFFILDFVFPEQMLVIELDGGIHECRRNYDQWRDEFVRECGFSTVRLGNEKAMTWDIGQIALLSRFPESIFRSALANANVKRGLAIKSERAKHEND